MSAPIEKVWTLLLDLPRVALCVPGVSVNGESPDGRTYSGTMQARIGPISASFEGTIVLREADDAKHQAVFRAEGHDRAGEVASNLSLAASAIDDTHVVVRSIADITITGRIGQFGRAVVQDLAKRMFSQFASNVTDWLEKGQAPKAGALGAMPSVLKGAVRVITGR